MQVGNEVVATAWEQLVLLIVQEWIYDAFWGFLSPDTTFPAEIRQLLLDVFGDVASRARSVDVNVVLGQLVHMLMVRPLTLSARTTGVRSVSYVPIHYATRLRQFQIAIWLTERLTNWHRQ
jgi:hypothetical protein